MDKDSDTAEITYTHEDAVRFKDEAKRLAYELELMREEIRLLRAKRFGASSEKSIADGQGVLFNEAEVYCRPQAEEPVIDEVAVAKRPRPKNKREVDLSGLP
ncbi:MAG: transposase, partial [Coriobacteriia bacterium]|nr:transposase [Coriobacteriia bacterium]